MQKAMPTALCATAFLVAALAESAHAQDEPSAVDAPALKVGDEWHYTQRDMLDRSSVTHFAVTVTAVAGDGATVTRTSDGRAPVTFQTDRNWSEPTMIGVKKTRYRYLDFPLQPGKRWKSSEGWTNRNNYAFENDASFTIVGNERVTVPAGTFDAIKISGPGTWRGLDNGKQAGSEVTLWYAPQVKRIVRYDFTRNAYRKGPGHSYSIELDRYHVQ